MDSNSELSLRYKSAWFNLKYLLLFLNMILFYININLFTKDLRKTQNFNLKDYPNLRYVTQISSDKEKQSLEDALKKSSNLNDLKESNKANQVNNEELFKNNRINNHKYQSLDEVVSMFGQQFGQQDDTSFKQTKGNLLNLIRNRKDDSNDLNNLNNELNKIGNLANSINFQDQLNENQNSNKNKTLIKKTNYKDLENLNKQLSLIYLLLALNNFLNFICLTKEKPQNFLLFLTLPSIFTILPLIITKFNCEINIWLFILYVSLAILTWIHVKRLKKSTSEQQQINQHPISRSFSNHHFVSLDSTSNPTSTHQFLIGPDYESMKSSLSVKENKLTSVSIEKKINLDQPKLTPAFKRIMNFKQMTPPPSYDQSIETMNYCDE